MINSVLQSIIQHKESEIAGYYRQFEELTHLSNKRDYECQLNDLAVNNKNHIYSVIKQSKPALILECKRGSPSKGLIRKKFDIERIVSTYNIYADVISVVTDEKYFWGSYDYLKEARRYTSLPLLCKDFFVDEIQLKLANYYGANIVLLMLSVLDNKQYEQLSRSAYQLGLEVLTEVHSEQELDRALELGAKIIGVNNRNLNDLSIDLSVSERLAVKIPPHLAIISESGISTHHDIERLQDCVDGFLIGSSLMEQADIKIACNRLFQGEPNFSDCDNS
jgi:indole-3-glycerol phosphate synthase/phosphoribosylanthranilate isomerase